MKTVYERICDSSKQHGAIWRRTSLSNSLGKAKRSVIQYSRRYG